ncbi:hypothetical protein H4R18_000723 [Coemansia javaensis]|uniref:MARVEL domain-containing protein n=1 Tax=Coemansia javaensis TaxID=2761396 RepID=A0A9W8HKC8_9FUNG|nr:hypothetical protein H4R18_000723 [Coemansia javaensis]
MVSTALLKLLRYSLYLAVLVLAFIELIVDAVALAGLKTINVFGFYYSFGPPRGAAGYTMFVTLATLFVVPIIAFGNLLANRGISLATRANHIVNEVAAASFFTVLWFAAAVAMAYYAGDTDCYGYSACSKFKAATAFAWFPFFVFLCLTITLVILLVRVRKAGAPLTTLAYEVDVEAGRPGPAVPQHVDAPYPSTGKSEGGYYGSQPQVTMPTPAH